MEHSKQLGEAKISALLIKFSIPAIVGMLVNALYNVVDRIFVGQGVGSDGIAGIAIGFPLMLIMMAFGMLIGLGATALISIRLGEQKKADAEVIIGNAVTLLVISSLVIMVFGLIFIDPLLKWFGASRVTLIPARAYLRIILLGSVFQAFGFGVNNFIRAEGNPRFAMLTMLIGAILNTILDPLFIFGFHMGIEGAAWATIISMAVSAGWVLYYYLSAKSLLKIHLKNFKLRFRIVTQITAIGSAPFLMQIAASGITILLNTSLATYGGDIAVSAMGIVNSVTMLILMPIFGINQGVQPIIGYNYGARQYDRVKKALKLAVLAATAVTLLGFFVTRIFPEQIIGLFSRKDAELLKIGSRALTIFLMALPIIGFQIVSSNYFQAVGKPKQAMLLSILRQVILLIPALLILPKFFGLDGVFYAGPVSDFGSFLLTGIWLFYEMRHLEAKHQERLLDTEIA